MKKRSLFTYAVVIVFALVIAWMPTGYYAMMPGKVWALDDVVQGGYDNSQTAFHMTTVSMAKANPVIFLYGKLVPNVDLVPNSNVIPAGWTTEQYDYYSKYLMQTSHNHARISAANLLALPYTEHTAGAFILRTLDDTQAEEVLAFGDIITAINQQAVTNTKDVSRIIKQYQPGETLLFSVTRNDEKLELSVTAGSDPDHPDTAFAGISVLNYKWEVDIPDHEIDITTGNISGPSAGLMLTMEIVNRLLPEDITLGKQIAGTGTIDEAGNVGKIGGIKQKIITATRAKMEIFFLPQSNWEDIKEDYQEYNEMTLVPVNTLQDALDYLMQLNDHQRMAKILPFNTQVLILAA